MAPAALPRPARPALPSVGVTPAGVFRAAFGIGPAVRVTTGAEAGAQEPAPRGDGRGAVDSTPAVEVARSEATVTAWRARSSLVAVEELRDNGSFVVKGVPTAFGGPVSDLRVTGSGIGDGLVGFRQGDADHGQVAAAVVDAPPLDFSVLVPLKFTRASKIRLRWDAAPNALSPVRYLVKVGGRTVARNVAGTSVRVPTKKLRDGQAQGGRDRDRRRGPAARRHVCGAAARPQEAARADPSPRHEGLGLDLGRQEGPRRGRAGLERADHLRRRQAGAPQGSRPPPLQAQRQIYGGREGARQGGQPRHGTAAGKRRMRIRLAVAVLVAGLLALPVGAAAHWGNGARIVSGSFARHELADANSRFAAISADGRYAVFETDALNLFPAGYADPPGSFREGGIFRTDLETNALEVVAYGDLKNPANGALITRGALNPTSSGDGRYVAFSTAYQLVPADTNRNVEVYVRDMSKPIDDPAAFELASALDGTDSPPTYTTTGIVGSELTPGVALSADGMKVVFRTMSGSDLSGAGTAALQLYVRDRAAKTTTLVTRTADGGLPAGGARGAAISADGTTVAWNGANAFVQTRVLTGEATDRTAQDFYLWQRVADGPAAPTRRITGPLDPDDPDCPPDEIVRNDPGATGPCYGPLAQYEDTGAPFRITDFYPSLSADGYRVAFAAGPALRPSPQGNNNDLFVTDMRPGITRKAGTLELTREGTGTTGPASDQIDFVAISADGNRLAFTTARYEFILSTPRLVDSPASVDPVVRELYLLDLPSMTIQRLSRAYDGTEIDSALNPVVSISGNGTSVAFASSARNLFLGDASDHFDAFVVSEPRDESIAGLSEPPFVNETSTPPPLGAKKPRLTVSITRVGSGLRLKVRAPGAGKVSVRARSRIAASGARKKRERTVATKTSKTSATGRATILLKPAPRYRSLVRRSGRLRARVVVTFTSSGLRLTARRTASFTS